MNQRLSMRGCCALFHQKGMAAFGLARVSPSIFSSQCAVLLYVLLLRGRLLRLCAHLYRVAVLCFG